MVPDTRSHRGADPRDRLCFASKHLENLRTATADLSWLLTRGYPIRPSLELIGDRFALRQRQRKAVGRGAASDESWQQRRERRIDPGLLAGQRLQIDGYNVLLTVEAALSGGVILACRDGTYRDMTAMSRHYRRVAETRAALQLIGSYLAKFRCAAVLWYLDRPVSNSGRLRGLILETAAVGNWLWSVELVPDPDSLLVGADELIATADSGILDCGMRWVDLARLVIEDSVEDPWIVDLGRPRHDQDPD